jgi:hypothetical protein
MRQRDLRHLVFQEGAQFPGGHECFLNLIVFGLAIPIEAFQHEIKVIESQCISPIPEGYLALTKEG